MTMARTRAKAMSRAKSMARDSCCGKSSYSSFMRRNEAPHFCHLIYFLLRMVQ